jgi:alginate O-acetyltransferase complex protein AlgI
LGYWKVFSFMTLGYVVHMLPSRIKNNIKSWYSDAHIITKILVFVGVVFCIYQAKSADIQPFIYFQF